MCESAHLATLMLANEPRMWMCVSASTMRVRVEFSIVNLVLPCLPEMRPMVRDRCSPRNVCRSDARPPVSADDKADGVQSS